MIRSQLYNPVTRTHECGGLELLEKWEASEELLLWLDLNHEDPVRDEQLMKERFGLHPLAITDALRERHPPKVEKFEEFLFVLLRGLTADTEDIDFEQISVAVFLGERWLLTRHSGESAGTDWLWEQISSKPEQMGKGVASVAIALLGRVVKRYVPILLALEPQLEIIEEQLFENPDDQMLEKLQNYKSRLTKLRRIFTYHGQVIEQLRNLELADDFKHELTDVRDDINRSQSLGQMYYDLASDLVATYISLASHRLNRIMQVLTIVTVLFVPLTFMAGIYGMNFEYMPELKLRYAYFVLLGVMGLVAVLLLRFFRGRKWI